MPWYGFVILFLVALGPFDALYVYIKNERRKEERRRREREAEEKEES